VKNLVVFLLTVILAFAIDLWLSIAIEDRFSSTGWVYIGLSAFFLFVNGYFIVIYSKDEVNKNRAFSEYEQQNKALSSTLSGVRNLLKQDSGSIARVYSDVKRWNTMDPRPLCIDEVCDGLCRHVYDSISHVHPDMDFEITYVNRISNAHVKTIGWHNKSGQPPNNYQRERSINDVNAYLDAAQFRENGNREIRRYGRNDLLSNGFVLSSGSRGQLKYNQYVSVPILCQNNRMIGLLQIVAMNDSLLATNNNQLRYLAENCFNSFAYFFLLQCKIEKVISLLTVTGNLN